MRKATTFIRLLGGTGSTGLGYGYLYNWYAISNVNFAPTEWTVPSIANFQTLVTYLGGSSVAGGYLKESGFTHWNSPNTGADNSSGFTSVGTGNRDELGGFGFLKIRNSIGVKEEYTSLTYQSMTTSYDVASAAGFIGGVSKKVGVSVRLLYTGTGSPSTVTDYDDNVYDTVIIGTQRWTVQNWKCTHYNDGTSIPEITDASTWTGLSTGARCAYNNDHSYI